MVNSTAKEKKRTFENRGRQREGNSGSLSALIVNAHTEASKLAIKTVFDKVGRRIVNVRWIRELVFQIKLVGIGWSRPKRVRKYWFENTAFKHSPQLNVIHIVSPRLITPD